MSEKFGAADNNTAELLPIHFASHSTGGIVLKIALVEAHTILVRSRRLDLFPGAEVRTLGIGARPCGNFGQNYNASARKPYVVLP
jgi:hypothetical protein